MSVTATRSGGGSRPRVVLPPGEPLATYQATASLHATAMRLGISREVARERLREAGVALRDQEGAMTVSVALQGPPRAYHESVMVECRGSTLVKTRRRRPYRSCVWPGCSSDAVHGYLCREHNDVDSEHQMCAWPRCIQRANSRFCYYHEGVTSGRLK